MSIAPRIYVASLTDYNNGTLHGCWIDADQDARAIYAEIEEMLAESPTMEEHPDQVAEEWAIHDYEGFPHLHEYETIETVAALGQALEEHGDAMRAFLSIYEGDPEDAVEQFEERYSGRYGSHREFVWGYLDDTGMWDTIPEWAQPYFDEDAYWEGCMQFDFDEVDGYYFSNN